MTSYSRKKKSAKKSGSVVYCIIIHQQNTFQEKFPQNVFKIQCYTSPAQLAEDIKEDKIHCRLTCYTSCA